LNAALQLEQDEPLEFLFGFEEALGYAMHGRVRDKDGLSAGLVFAGLAEGRRLLSSDVGGALSELYARHGLWSSALHTIAFENTPEEIHRVHERVERFRQAPPKQLGGLRVERVTDYLKGAAERPWYLGQADLLELELEGQARVLLRPSGTEPKLKIYADFVEAYAGPPLLAEQERAVQKQAADLARALGELVNSV